MTPAQEALREAAAAETARIYAATLRETERAQRAELARFTNTAEQIAERRRVAESISDGQRHLQSVS